ncbi:MAG: right-handed parallel beta-helix repeat-containing protein [Flavobacteriales bacterium]|nr:right-handed parallel beta-helix repeat-containing protein [Flavobacteriales bacterium]
MRSKRKKGSTPVALLTGLGLPLLALFGVFSLIPYESMTARWPMGITADEVHAYQHWFDQRPDTMAEVEVERFDLDTDGPCSDGDGSVRRLTTKDRVDTVTFSRAGDDPILVFSGSRTLDDQHAVRLSPADMSSIRVLYAAEVAHAYGMPSGKTRVVKLGSCGDDEGLFLVQEAIDQRFVDAHGSPGSLLVDSSSAKENGLVAQEAARSLHGLGEGDLGRINRNAAAVWALVMSAARNGDARPMAWFDPANGRYEPAFGASASIQAAVSDQGRQAVEQYLGTNDAQEKIRVLAATMRQDSADLTARLAEIDARNASAFVGDTRIGYVRAQLVHERAEFLRRLFHPELEVGAPMQKAADGGTQVARGDLDPLLRKYLVGDTIRFPRAKHLIDHVITVPAGYGVVLEKGARLNMAPGSGLVVHGSLHMRGTGLNPVFVRPTDDGAAWAGIQVKGSGETRCVITGLKMSGGGASMTDEGLLKAMLGFQGCDVSITKSVITDAKGEAAIAVLRGSLKMEETVLGSGPSALVDASFAACTFTKCSFLGEGTAQGIKGNGAKISATDCGFTKFGSTGIDLSMRSRAALKRCVFSGNNTAVQATNGAEVAADGCTFSGNAVGIALKRLKEGQDGGSAVVYQNTFVSNGADKEVDAASRWTAGTGAMPEDVSSATGRD